jgi:hypothetical protein
MCLMAQSLMMCLVRGNVQPLTSVYMVSKSPRPAPSSHWPLDSLANFGSWDSRASDAKISCSIGFNRSLASRPIRPYVETTNGTNDRC